MHVLLRLLKEPFLVHAGENRRAGGLLRRGGRFFRLFCLQEQLCLLGKRGEDILPRKLCAQGRRRVFPVGRLHGSHARVVELLLLFLHVQRLQILQRPARIRELRFQLRALCSKAQLLLLLLVQLAQTLLCLQERTLRVREKACFVVLHAVELLAQAAAGGGIADSFVARGDECGQPRLQRIVRCQAKPRLPDERAALIDALRHAEQRFAAVLPR